MQRPAWPLTGLALAFREGPSGVDLPVQEIKIELLAQQERGPEVGGGCPGEPRLSVCVCVCVYVCVSVWWGENEVLGPLD